MVRIDDVYQKVLALANKEQRGYITPQEFNLFADQAQMEIFEQYFYDLDQFERRPGSESDYYDNADAIRDKIQIFHDRTNYSTGSSTPLPNDTYRIVEVTVMQNVGGKIPGITPYPILADKIDRSETTKYNMSPLTKATLKRPIWWLSEERIYIAPAPDLAVDATQGRITVIKRPIKPNWTYVIHNQSALYNNSDTSLRNFQLHSSEENKLVIKILQLSGITIKDFNLAQAAGQKEAIITQQQKQ